MKYSSIVIQSQDQLDTELLRPFQDSPSVLVQVYAATPDEEKITAVLSSLKQALPDAVIIGLSSDGTIENGVIYPYGDVIQVAITGFDRTDLKACFVSPDGSSDEAGRLLAENICTDNTKVVVAFSEAISINGEEFLEGIYSVNRHLIVSGGVASTPTFTDTFVIYGTGIHREGAVAVALNSDELHAFRDHSFGWLAIGKEMVITEAEHNRVKTINNKTPLEIFRHYLGDRIASELPGIGSAFPLMIRRGNNYIARGIIALEGQEFIVSGNVRENDKVYIGYGNPFAIARRNKLAESVVNKVEAPEVIFSYYCEGRRLFMPSHLVEYEVGVLGSLGPLNGVFTLGEFYTDQDYSLLNFSSTLLILSEQETVEPGLENISHEPPPVEHVFELVSEGLFHLIDTRTRELEHQAYHDELTGLPNKAFFIEILRLAIQSTAFRPKEILAVFFIDIDNFKNINDTQGHPIGDLLLSKIAERIQAAIPPTNTLARYGGDEFLLLAVGNTSINQVIDQAQHILGSLSEPFTHDERSYPLTASIGISLYPSDGQDQDELIRHADAAMYEVKGKGKNSFSFYHPSFTQRVLERISIESEFHKAIRENQLELHFQPQVDLRTREIVSAEALVRWKHPDRGLVMPGEYIELAEETGLILPMGEIVLDCALKQLREWLDKGLELEKVSVNISGKQFNSEDFVPSIVRLLNQYALPPKYLDLELTESVIMADTGKCLEKINELRHLGVTISIDDFGTGYSSLSYLKRFNINTLKIDKSFIDNIPDDEHDIAITEAIIGLAKALKLQIVAEGVETSEHERFLLYKHCDVAQGYLYSKPLPATEFESFYRDWPRRQ